MAARKEHHKPLPPPVESADEDASIPLTMLEVLAFFGWAGLLGLVVTAFVAYMSFSSLQAYLAPRAPAAPVRAALAAPPPVAAPAAFRQPTTLTELLAVPTVELGQVDVARMNLLCMEGLPGAEDLNLNQCLATLDGWAAAIKQETNLYNYQFVRNPAKYQNSPGRFEMTMLMFTLGKLGVHYDDNHPNDEPSLAFFTKADTISLHHLLGPQHSGTCASLPVLVVALGRRLGYPLQLVATPQHGFARWDDGRERFNIEATTSGGLNIEPDDYYRHFPNEITEDMIAADGYLQSESPAQELASFLQSRATCLVANRNYAEAQKVDQICLKLMPTSRLFLKYSQ